MLLHKTAFYTCDDYIIIKKFIIPQFPLAISLPPAQLIWWPTLNIPLTRMNTEKYT